MTKFVGNLVGYASSSSSDNGLYNISQHFFLSSKRRWGFASGSVTSGTDVDTITVQNQGYDIKYHVFKSPGTLDITVKGEVGYTIIAGGGAGGQSFLYYTDTGGGGGGAGGMRTGRVNLDTGTYTVTVGSGGVGSPVTSAPTSGSPSSISGPSNFTTITSAGGGRGGRWNPPSGSAPTYPVQPGGSGGGGPAQQGYPSGATGNSPPVTPPQGNPGGSGEFYGGGGGGGAGESGKNGNTSPGSKSPPTSMNGGIGREFGVYGFDSLPTSYGTPGPSTGRWFAGGGGGASGLTSSDPLAYGLGGDGGGGDGGVSRLPINNAATSGEDGLTNTGGGGGSPGSYTNPRPFSWLGSGDGGPGIVIIGYVYQ